MIASPPKVRNASTRFDKRSENSAKKGPEDLTVEELMLRIIQKVNFSSQSPQETSEVTEAILEMDLDDMHYTLIRSSPKHTYHLSPREQEIVRLVAEGLPNKCISAVLEISSWTVATHLRRIFAKLGVDTRAAMVYRCASLIGEQPAPVSCVTAAPPSRPKN
jgi:two-component system, NarL family, nitrate/nitrite response regulator NarL